MSICKGYSKENLSKMADSQLEFYMVQKKKKKRKTTPTVPLFVFSDFTAILHVFHAKKKFKNGLISEKRANFEKWRKKPFLENLQTLRL